MSYVVLGELDLNGFGVSCSLPLLIKQLFRVAHPGQKLIQRMLELPQSQQRSFQFVLHRISTNTSESGQSHLVKTLAMWV